MQGQTASIIPATSRVRTAHGATALYIRVMIQRLEERRYEAEGQENMFGAAAIAIGSISKRQQRN